MNGSILFLLVAWLHALEACWITRVTAGIRRDGVSNANSLGGQKTQIVEQQASLHRSYEEPLDRLGEHKEYILESVAIPEEKKQLTEETGSIRLPTAEELRDVGSPLLHSDQRQPPGIDRATLEGLKQILDKFKAYFVLDDPLQAWQAIHKMECISGIESRLIVLDDFTEIQSPEFNPYFIKLALCIVLRHALYVVLSRMLNFPKDSHGLMIALIAQQASPRITLYYRDLVLEWDQAYYEMNAVCPGPILPTPDLVISSHAVYKGLGELLELLARQPRPTVDFAGRVARLPDLRHLWANHEAHVVCVCCVPWVEEEAPLPTALQFRFSFQLISCTLIHYWATASGKLVVHSIGNMGIYLNTCKQPLPIRRALVCSPQTRSLFLLVGNLESDGLCLNWATNKPGGLYVIAPRTVFAIGTDMQVDGQSVTGTSFATPVVAAAAAGLKAACPELSMEQVAQCILDSATPIVWVRKEGELLSVLVALSIEAADFCPDTFCEYVDPETGFVRTVLVTPRMWVESRRDYGMGRLDCKAALRRAMKLAESWPPSAAGQEAPTKTSSQE